MKITLKTLNQNILQLGKQLLRIEELICERLPKKEKKKLLAKILQVTEICPSMLIDIGLFNSTSNACKMIKSLVMPIKKRKVLYEGKHHSFYSLDSEEIPTHTINYSISSHDGLLAVFLAEIATFLDGFNVDVYWHNKSMIDGKESDGGISLHKKNKLLYSILLEVDKDTYNNQKEMREKFLAYAKFISGQKHRKIIFVVDCEERREELEGILDELIIEGQICEKHQFYFYIPLVHDLKKLFLQLRNKQ